MMQLKNNFFKLSQCGDVEGKYSCKIELVPDHFIFKAHFPGNPIVPGVCQVHMVTELLAEKLGRQVYLREIKNIKYLSVMTPTSQLHYEVNFQKVVASDEDCKVVVVFSDEEKPYTKLSLTYSYQKI